MIKILFVCTGNICRSPTAEGIFRKLVDDKGLSNKIYIDSAGTHEFHVGRPPDSRAQQEASNQGIDISNLRARQLETEDFELFDYILAMDEYNLECISFICPDEHKNKVLLLLSYHPDPDLNEVPDPYYDSVDGFSNVYRMIFDASEQFLKTII